VKKIPAMKAPVGPQVGVPQMAIILKQASKSPGFFFPFFYPNNAGFKQREWEHGFLTNQPKKNFLIPPF